MLRWAFAKFSAAYAIWWGAADSAKTVPPDGKADVDGDADDGANNQKQEKSVAAARFLMKSAFQWRQHSNEKHLNIVFRKRL